jgi:hypothetical protein
VSSDQEDWEVISDQPNKNTHWKKTFFKHTDNFHTITCISRWWWWWLWRRWRW